MATPWLLWVFAMVNEILLLSMVGGQVVEVDRSHRAYGPDGPWYAWKASIGTPRQHVDLIFARKRASWPLANNCDQRSSTCPSLEAGFYDSASSSTVNVGGPKLTRQLNLFVERDQIAGSVQIKSTYQPSSDVFRIYSAGKEYVCRECGLVTLYNAKVVNVSKSSPKYPLTLGSFGIGTPYGKEAFGFTNPPFPKHQLLPSLFASNKIASLSFTLTVGSPTVGIEPRLVLGGYDYYKVLGPVFAQPVPVSTYFRVLLTDLGLITEDNYPSPFQGGMVPGLLRDNTGAVSSISPAIVLEAPYLALPAQTCERLAAILPISYNKTYGLYLWNTHDPKYHQILSSASSLYFQLLSSSHSEPVRIKVPLRLLSLTLSDPIVTGKNLTYFPLRPTDDPVSYSLGRSFLQAANFGINWATTQGGESYMFIAQAPGPGKLPGLSPGAKRLDEISIETQTLYAYGDSTIFEKTWRGYWNAYASPTHAGPSSTPEKGHVLSTGAKAGIGVSVGVTGLIVIVLIACVIWRRHRRRRRQSSSQSPPEKSMPLPRPGIQTEAEQSFAPVTSSSPTLTNTGDTITSSYSARTELHNVSRTIYEMPGSDARPTELESPVTPRRMSSMLKA